MDRFEYIIVVRQDVIYNGLMKAVNELVLVRTTCASLRLLLNSNMLGDHIHGRVLLGAM